MKFRKNIIIFMRICRSLTLKDYIVSVDVATENLLGSLSEIYGGKINLSIDHHGTNTEYAENLLLRETAAACELIYEVVLELGAEIDKDIANCLFTGISTDTGSTFMIAAKLVECGADNGFINRVMFETKTKTYARLERLAIDNMQLYCNDKVAIMAVTQEMYKQSGSNEQETEALAPLTRQVEGVEIGITIREKPDGSCKASFRTFEKINAAEIAKLFGGGGHPQAAACRLDCSVNEAVKMLAEKCGEFVK